MLSRLIAAAQGGSGREEMLAADNPFSLQLQLVIISPTLSQPPDRKIMASPSHIRSLYRSILREIPHRPLSTPSSIQQRIRSSFNSSPDGSNHDTTVAQQVAEGEQFLQYAKAQRMYSTLLERYNPGIGSVMDEDERTRLTARRVGINLPEEYSQS